MGGDRQVMTSLTAPADMYKVLAAEFIIFGKVTKIRVDLFHARILLPGRWLALQN